MQLHPNYHMQYQSLHLHKDIVETEECRDEEQR